MSQLVVRVDFSERQRDLALVSQSRTYDGEPVPVDPVTGPLTINHHPPTYFFNDHARTDRSGG